MPKWLHSREGKKIKRMNKKAPAYHSTWLPTAASRTNVTQAAHHLLVTANPTTEVETPYTPRRTPSPSTQHTAKHKLHNEQSCSDQLLSVRLDKQAVQWPRVYKRVTPSRPSLMAFPQGSGRPFLFLPSQPLKADRAALSSTPTSLCSNLSNAIYPLWLIFLFTKLPGPTNPELRSRALHAELQGSQCTGSLSNLPSLFRSEQAAHTCLTLKSHFCLKFLRTLKKKLLVSRVTYQPKHETNLRSKTLQPQRTQPKKLTQHLWSHSAAACRCPHPIIKLQFHIIQAQNQL